MSQPRDYYETLGVKKNATADEIRRAYRTLARKYHPDVSTEQDAATRFAEVTEAYEVLSDAEKRKAYDRFGHSGVNVGVGPGPGPGPGGGFRTTGFDPGDLGGIFDELFGGRSPFGAGAAGATRPGARRPKARSTRGADVKHTITVPFELAALGGEQPVRLARGGRTENISVHIPPAIEDGAKLRVRGRGQAGPPGGQPGDLIITVRVAEHSFFRRQGLDLLVDVPISIAEAALGVTVKAPLLKGSVQIKVPPGTSSGRKMRVPGKGLKGGGGKTGDFFAVIHIVAPDEISPHGRDLLDQLRTELKNPRESSPWADH